MCTRPGASRGDQEPDWREQRQEAPDALAPVVRPGPVADPAARPGVAVGQVDANRRVREACGAAALQLPAISICRCDAADEADRHHARFIDDNAQVGKVLGRRPTARLWFGTSSTLLYIVSWLPLWVSDALLSKRFGLTQQTAALLKAKAAALKAETTGR